MNSLYSTGIRPHIDAYLKEQSEKVRDYGDFWSASSAGYCMRKSIFERLGVPSVSKDGDERKTRVFESGHIFHEWMQRITKNAGLSIAQELELEDTSLMVRGHIDDLVLVGKSNVVTESGAEIVMIPPKPHLILYDYKTAHSRSFHYSKDRSMSHYHRMQVGTYMYMLRSGQKIPTEMNGLKLPTPDSLIEARVMSISKDDLCMVEKQLLWTPELEKEIVGYWTTLNGYWQKKTIPKCTCADYEGGFMSKETYNPYFMDGEPCSLKWYEKNKKEEKS